MTEARWLLDWTFALRRIRATWPILSWPALTITNGVGKSADPVNGLDRRVSLIHDVTLTLNGWARIVVEDRGTTHGIPLGSDGPGLCIFLERHGDWMSTHPASRDALDEVTTAAARVQLSAFPPQREWVTIGECPCTVADEGGNSVVCGGQVRAYPDDPTKARIRQPSCERCGHEDTFDWWVSQIVPEAADLATATSVIAAIAFRHNHLLSHEQIRQWAARGFIQRHGKDVKGRTLYRVAAVVAYATRQEREAEAA